MRSSLTKVKLMNNCRIITSINTKKEISPSKAMITLPIITRTILRSGLRMTIMTLTMSVGPVWVLKLTGTAGRTWRSMWLNRRGLRMCRGSGLVSTSALWMSRSWKMVSKTPGSTTCSSTALASSPNQRRSNHRWSRTTTAQKSSKSNSPLRNSSPNSNSNINKWSKVVTALRMPHLHKTSATFLIVRPTIPTLPAR